MDKHLDNTMTVCMRGDKMKGFKISIVLTLFTILVCAIMLLSTADPVSPLKKDVQTMDNSVSQGIVKEEGSFSAEIYYEYCEGMDIYFVKYDDRGDIKAYNISAGKIEKVLTPMNAGNKIHTFFKSGDFYAWEEDSIMQEDMEDTGQSGSWMLYVRKGNHITRIDQGKDFETNAEKDLKLPPQKLSASGNYLVYKTYDLETDPQELKAVIKLYDMNADRGYVIFSLPYNKNTELSEPSVYGNHVVWSISNGNGRGDMYLYDISSGSTSKLTEKGSLLNPVIWGDYIVCSSMGSDGPSIAVLNYNTGLKKYIAFSDYTLFPKMELHDYTIGEGYVTWNSSYADTVSVYDMISDKVYELKKSAPSGNNDNSLLNIRLYGKTLVYTDHVFNKNNGKTVTETNRYIILK